MQTPHSSPDSLKRLGRRQRTRADKAPPRFFYGAALIALGLAALSFNGPGCKEEKPRLVGDLVINHPVPLQWTELEPGLDYTLLDFSRRADGQGVRVAAVKADPRRFRFSLLSAPEVLGPSAAMVKEMAAKAGSIAAVNASFYLPETYEPIGLLVWQGKLIHHWHGNAGSGVFWFNQGKAGIEWAKDYKPAWDREELVVQAGPLIIEPGGRPGIYQDSQKYRTRTAVGVDGRGKVVLVCTFRQGQGEEDLSGLDLFELMQIMALPEAEGGLGLRAALNLDGGTSSAMYLNHPRMALDIQSTHPVRNAIAVLKK